MTENKTKHSISAQVPRMTILSDHPTKDTFDSPDELDLPSRLGAAFDILRHKNTRTPITVAIYGDWGTGKTSAMRWLETRLKEWNDLPEKEREGHPRVYPIWFDPWKYGCREDVWRGIIAEVILAFFKVGSLDRQNLVPRLREAAKQFGAFLGKGFLQALANVELKLGPKDGPELGVKGEMFRDIYDEFERANHPEKAYLNQFEDSLRGWIQGFLKEEDGQFAERVALFIDDLDRCLPSVTLEVLEAIKLYLNIEPLMFVVGLDRTVIDGVVEKHYVDHGLGKDKSRQYLDKIFQVEIQIPPSEHQIGKFLDRQIAALDDSTAGFWSKMLQDAKHRRALEEGIRQLSRHNPREVKRLLSSALLRGRAAVDNMDIGESDEKARFAQGVQFFLIQRFFRTWVSDANRLFLEEARLSWFSRYSEFLRQHPDYEPPSKDQPTETKAGVRVEEIDLETLEAYSGLLQDPNRPVRDDGTYVDAPRLEDPLLRSLLGIPFSVEVAQSAPRLDPAVKKAAIASATAGESFDIAVVPNIIRERVAVDLKKPVDQVSAVDVSAIRKMNLASTDCSDSDLVFVAKLTALQELVLQSTNVTDTGVAHLAALSALRRLNLRDTKVSDSALKHLAKLIALQGLNLSVTNVTDAGLADLTNLSALTDLYLVNTRVSDDGLARVAKLTSLLILHLGSTVITDDGLAHLASLTALLVLGLAGTGISDAGLSHLAKLSTLQILVLDGTKVTDAGLVHLANLTALQHLNLTDTRVDGTGLAQLAKLNALRRLDLSGSSVTDAGIAHLPKLANLQSLGLSRTKVTSAGTRELRRRHPNMGIIEV